jgi:hypothetical protein
MAMDYYRYQENEEMSSEQTESMFLYRVYREIAKRKNRRRRKKKEIERISIDSRRVFLN